MKIGRLMRSALLLLVIIGIGIAAVVVRPTGAPDYTGAPPELHEDGHIEHVTSQVVPMPLDAFLAWHAENPILDFLQPRGQIPAVEGVTLLEGNWTEAGDRRRVNLAGGHSAAEQILERSETRFRYQIWGATTSARYVIDHAEGIFDYADQGDGTTRVTWTYRMAPKAVFTRPVLVQFMEADFAPFMGDGLARMAEAAEEVGGEGS
ncbi:SRPBCC family protein [Aestuariibius insulae]|uniref:SRPBCC family protein n=1 Tax=Aestuariibius insulae TaxID=2058287 RepID=UPI00345E20BB